MKTLHALAFSLLASLLAPAFSAESPSPLAPVPREQPQWWRQQYEQQVEQVKNNPCGVLFLGDSITDYWKREGKQIWEKTFSPYHPCNFGISGDQTTNLIYRITDSGIPARTEPKLCIVMIGTYNTGQFKGAEAPVKTARGILGAADRLQVGFPDTHVIILGIFPRGTGPQDKLRQHNDKINAVLAQCKLPRTTYVNINKRFLDSSGKLLPGISRDNLHFTEKGYAIWADAVLPYIKKYCK
ncbi:GDSL-type esterase/lipase family protein [Akkermansia massiliensis]